jgi:hypothetical protein
MESFSERSKKVHVAMPLRITYLDENVKTGTEMACTYDVDSRGARVIGMRQASHVGQIVMVERGRNKALFQICWIGDPQSELRGQCGIECIEDDKVPWKTDFAELEELYTPLQLHVPQRRTKEQERRRVPRYAVQGIADLLKRRHCAPLQAQLTDLSHTGCKLLVPALVATGTEVEVSFRISECEISVQGEVRHAGLQHSGIQFRSIRRGDGPLLECFLRSISADGQDQEAARWNFEVVATQ